MDRRHAGGDAVADRVQQDGQAEQECPTALAAEQAAAPDEPGFVLEQES